MKPKISSKNGKRGKSTSASIPQDSAPSTEEIDLTYGRHAVLSVLKGDRQINRIWLTDKLMAHGQFYPLIKEAKANGTIIDEVSPLRLSQLTQGGNHQGIAAQVAPYIYWDLTELIDRAKQIADPVVIIADGIEDPHNLGAIVRTAEALGCPGSSNSPASGSRCHLYGDEGGSRGIRKYGDIARVVNLNQAIAKLKDAGFWIYGTTADTDQMLHKTNFSGAVGLVIGSEGKGLSQSTAKNCDQLVAIPLVGNTPSLNASVAAAIALYEVFRQRQ